MSINSFTEYFIINIYFLIWNVLHSDSNYLRTSIMHTCIIENDY